MPIAILSMPAGPAIPFEKLHRTQKESSPKGAITMMCFRKSYSFSIYFPTSADVRLQNASALLIS